MTTVQIEIDRVIDLMVLSIATLEQEGDAVDLAEFVELMLPNLPSKDQKRIVRLLEAEFRRLQDG